MIKGICPSVKSNVVNNSRFEFLKLYTSALFGDNLYVNILPTIELVLKTVEMSAKFKVIILELPHILISGYAEDAVD